MILFGGGGCISWLGGRCSPLHADLDENDSYFTTCMIVKAEVNCFEALILWPSLSLIPNHRPSTVLRIGGASTMIKYCVCQSWGAHSSYGGADAGVHMSPTPLDPVPAPALVHPTRICSLWSRKEAVACARRGLVHRGHVHLYAQPFNCSLTAL